jgi:antitoxin HigA-1
MAVQLHSSISIHPGPWLKRNVVDHYSLTVTEVADRLKVSRPAMSNLLNGKAALSPDMAIRFEKGLGIPADTMLRMQVAHDLAEARSHEKEIKVDRVIPELESA